MDGATEFGETLRKITNQSSSRFVILLLSAMCNYGWKMANT